MTQPRTRAAKRNLREGIKKMEQQSMTPAARVRREFRLGRNPRPLDENERMEPLHPDVVWRRATDALSNFRERMAKAGLKTEHVAAAIIFIDLSSANPDLPRTLPLEQADKSGEEMYEIVVQTLAKRGVAALGLIFAQFDEQKKQRTLFPYQFFSLNKRGANVLRNAAEAQVEGLELLRNVPS